ncbi:hypothetical protein [Nocardioides sp.]|uniref:hypothetical protein n=1 Tax=Nocardioides sp. TaxID=35761 RepID=UPI003783CA15
MNRLEVPSSHYDGVGKVAVAAAKLEAMLGRVLVAARLADVGDDWLDATTKRPLEVLKKGRRKFPTGHPVRDLYAQSRKALNDRNRIVHSLAYFDGDLADWVLVHPKSGQDIPMPTSAEFEELRTRLNMLSAKCLHVENLILADSVRTEEAR